MAADTPKALPHQIQGVSFLRARDAAGLFDEQGLGKSKQLIEAISQEIASGTLSGALIICPNILKSTWADEVEKHSSHRYAVFGAGKRARRDAFRSLTAAFYVINYEAVSAELPSLRALLRFKRMALVLDESHRIKTPDAKVTKAVLALRHDAARRYAMSGTPVANKPEDLWAQMLFLDDGASTGATFEEFKQRYRPGAKYANLDDLRAKLSAVSLRRRKAGTIDLPSKSYERISVGLAGEQKDMYERMRNELALWVTNMSGDQVLKSADDVLTRLVRLAQLASNPSLLDARFTGDPAKFRVLDEILEANKGNKAIVWTSFVGNIPVLLQRYAHLSPVCIHGAIKGPEREKAIRSFKKDTSVQLMVANPAAAREGLTLTEASLAIYLDRTFNLVDYLQSQDRIHRISQTQPCRVVLLIAKDTIDEFVDFSLEQKGRLAGFAQNDLAVLATDDFELRKPDVLNALLQPC